MQNDQSKTYFLIIPKISLRKHLVICKSIRERLTQYAASNASGKPHCDFAFLPLVGRHANCLLGIFQTPMKRRIDPAAMRLRDAALRLVSQLKSVSRRLNSMV